MSFFHNLPLKYKIFCGCLLVALIPLLFSSFLMVRIFNAALTRQNIYDGNQQLNDITLKLDEFFTTTGDSCKKLASDQTIVRAMIDTSTVDIEKDVYLSLYQSLQDNYGNITLCLYDSGGQLKYTTDSMAEPTLMTNWGILRKASQKSGLVYYSTDKYMNHNNDLLLQSACPIESTGGALMGYVVLNYNRKALDHLFNGMYSENSTIFILDSYMHVLYGSGGNYEVNGADEMISLWETEPVSGFCVMIRQNAGISSPAVRSLKTVNILLALLGLLLSLIISLILSRSFSRPISNLDKAMEKVRDGDLSVRVYNNRSDELGHLNERFNQMTSDLALYIDSAVRKQKDLNETTLKLYQTQLNPHFLYNTLDTIKWSAKINKIPEIATLAENLAVILRQSISSKPFITLRDELETIDNYTAIQKIRFSGRFFCELEVPDNLLECLVPKMLLQPLVENAIIHGLDGMENGYICIYATQSDKDITISVTDDGIGMPKDIISWINSDEPCKREGHLGLYNILYILKLYYGHEYGLKATSNLGEGTTITVTLPLVFNNPEVINE